MNPARIRQTGLSLVELMVSITIGMLILAGVVAIFSSNQRTRDEIEQMSRQIENGRYALQLLSEDLQMAGYLGEYVPSTTPTVLPDPCDTDLADLDAARLVHVQGYNDVTSSPLSCLSDVKTGTDIIVVRRASTCIAKNWTTSTDTETNCDAVVSNVPYLQVSGCASDSVTYKLNTDVSQLTLKKVGCTNAAPMRRYRTHIYFLANNNISGDGIPTLKRAELGADGFSIVPLAAGIENLQLQYGWDTTSDGVPDSYVNAASLSSVTDWWNTMAVKIALLARNEETATNHTDTKTYTLLDKNVAAANDSYRRHAYTALVKLANPAGRREQ